VLTFGQRGKACVEREIQEVCQAAHAPEVHLVGVLVLLDDLGGEIERGAAEGVCSAAFFQYC